ncbi:hypothetical protein GNZ12_34050 [Paraburkholderia sp. 1N]|uniref:Uncharacterized protein n=1 Tax=Paraburkholderia solitsugae TaxID=2675748 RepID=A0ABX2BNP8_9BURK|nr:hypothetical protein [Paraburkholderia solitsugae]NPT42381.1 hypothetical protein [Paraburkholderia solitsugae]NPT46262.1 hypothetical protein [Paraburkholderia solitsugae]
MTILTAAMGCTQRDTTVQNEKFIDRSKQCSLAAGAGGLVSPMDTLSGRMAPAITIRTRRMCMRFACYPRFTSGRLKSHMAVSFTSILARKNIADRGRARKHASRLLKSFWSFSRNNTAFTLMICDRQINHDHSSISQGWTKVSIAQIQLRFRP